MIVTADWLMHQGARQRGMGMALGASGRILAVAPARELGPADHHFHGACVLPGLTDAYAAQFWRTHPRGAPLRVQREALEAGFAERLACGVTLLGLPFGQPGAPDAPWGDLTLADLHAAVQRVGLRVSVIEPFALPHGRAATSEGAAVSPWPTAHFEDALEAFERRVHALVQLQDRRLSWAMAVADVPAMPIDALMSLRVRLGHLPLLIEAGPHQPDRVVQQLAQHGLLDSCVGVVENAPLGPWAHLCLAREGARLVQPPHSPPVGGYGAQAPNCGACTGHTQALSPWAPWVRPEVGQAAEVAHAWHAATRGAQAALGLQGGGLVANSPADFFVVPMGPHPPAGPQSKSSPINGDVTEPAPLDEGAYRASEVWVAGRLVRGPGLAPGND
jgi:hypothetical protein